jgi:hypothetical protein
MLAFEAPTNRVILTKERPKYPEIAQNSVNLALRAPKAVIEGASNKAARLWYKQRQKKGDAGRIPVQRRPQTGSFLQKNAQNSPKPKQPKAALI